jgi:hypothetical protein
MLSRLAVEGRSCRRNQRHIDKRTGSAFTSKALNPLLLHQHSQNPLLLSDWQGEA